MRRFSFLSRSEMKFLTKTVNILIKIFLIGLLLQFLLQTFFTYKLGFDGAVRNAVWLRKEIVILVFLAIILYLLWKKSQEIWVSALWSWLKSQKAFRFLIYFVVLCVVTFVLAVLVQRVGIGAYILTVKYDVLDFCIRNVSCAAPSYFYQTKSPIQWTAQMGSVWGVCLASCDCFLAELAQAFWVYS